MVSKPMSTSANLTGTPPLSYNWYKKLWTFTPAVSKCAGRACVAVNFFEWFKLSTGKTFNFRLAAQRWHVSATFPLRRRPGQIRCNTQLREAISNVTTLCFRPQVPANWLSAYGGKSIEAGVELLSALRQRGKKCLVVRMENHPGFLRRIVKW